MKNFLILIVFISLFACKEEPIEALFSSNKNDIQSSKLIDPSDLMKEMNADFSHNRIIQVSQANTYKKEHLPGALNIWRPDYGSDNKNPFGGLMASKEKIEKLLGKMGATQKTVLYLYDTKGNVDACRFAWVLKYYGFTNYFIINGGIKYWKSLGYLTDSLSVDWPDSTSLALSGKWQEEMSATFEDVKNAIDDEQTIIIDTREDYEYLGQPFIHKNKLYKHKKGAFTHGAIPSAIHLNWSTLSDLTGDHRIKSEQDIRHDLKQKGITADKNIILYCQSGSRTSHTYFVLKEILGFPNVSNYDGSWIEWSYNNSIDSSVPLWQQTDSLQFFELYSNLEKELIKDDEVH